MGVMTLCLGILGWVALFSLVGATRAMFYLNGGVGGGEGAMSDVDEEVVYYAGCVLRLMCGPLVLSVVPMSCGCRP